MAFKGLALILPQGQKFACADGDNDREGGPPSAHKLVLAYERLC